MKRVSQLSASPDDSTCEEARKAFDQLTSLGFKPYLVKIGKESNGIRVHIGKRYFSFSAITNKWIAVHRQGGKKWHESAGVDDFVKRARSWQKGIMLPTPRQIDYLLSLTEGGNIDQQWLSSVSECAKAIDQLKSASLVTAGKVGTSLQ